jgi:PAS domain S-box-containing protein
MSAARDREEELLRAVALQNAQSILAARRRAEDELVRTREALRVNEERLRAVFNQAAVGMAVASLDGRFVEINRKFADVLGYSPEELTGLTFNDITHPGDRAATLASVQRLVEGTGRDYAVEKRYLRKDGVMVWTHTTVTVLKDADNQPRQLIAVIEDITAKKAAEAALHDETRILELLNGTGQMLASSLDLREILQAVTDAATELSGAEFGAFFFNTTEERGESYQLYTLSGAPREAFDNFGEPRATALFGHTFRGGGPLRIGNVQADPRYGKMPPHYGMPKGHLPVCSYLAVAVRSRSGDVVGGLFFGHSKSDVFTERAERLVAGVASQAGIALDNARLYEAAQKAADERKALLESERAARTAAERLSDLKDEFLATLSHELRTPLNAILGWTQVLRTVPGKEADVLKGLDIIERNARMQTKLIEDLLDMSRISSGKLRLDIQPVQPLLFVEAAIETLKPAAVAKGIRLEPLLDPTAGPISGDPARLQQVVWNLLSNAIKFTPKNGRVQVVLERLDSHAQVTIADTGSGITPESIPQLFERFRQGDASTTRQHGGLGLGLSIVKRLVELHGGTVTVSSDGPGHGTTAVVCLPLAIVRENGRGRRDDADTSGLSPLRAPATELAGVRILVVDDHTDARELVKRVLEDSGATVTTAAGALEALALVESERPDVLVSDIGMPDIDGFDLIQRVRALGPDRGGQVPAVALTAFARSEDRTRALRAGFQVHVSKPVDAAELIATVVSVAGRLDRPGRPSP